MLISDHCAIDYFYASVSVYSCLFTELTYMRYTCALVCVWPVSGFKSDVTVPVDYSGEPCFDHGDSYDAFYRAAQEDRQPQQRQPGMSTAVFCANCIIAVFHNT